MKIALSILVFSFLTPGRGVAANTSSKSYNCVAALEQVLVGKYMESQNTQSRGVYTLNAVAAFGRHIIGVSGAEAGLPYVYAHSEMEPTSKSVQAISSRLKGIEIQSQQANEVGLNERRNVYAFTLTNEEDIGMFLDAVVRRSEGYRYAPNRLERILKFYKHGSISGAGLALMGFMSNALPLIAFGGGMALGTWIAAPPPAFLQEMERNNLEKFEALQDVLYSHKAWAMISHTIDVNPDLLKSFLDTERLTQAHQLANDSRLYSEMPILRTLFEKILKTKKRTVLSTDIIIENSTGAPELHVVVRFSENRPVFPRTKKKWEEDRKQSPLLEPGLVPIPTK